MYKCIGQQVDGQLHNCGGTKLIKEGKIAADFDNTKTEF
jgi:hypothetical protein